MIAQRVRLRGVQQGFSLCQFLAHHPPQMTDQKAGRGRGRARLGIDQAVLERNRRLETPQPRAAMQLRQGGQRIAQGRAAARGGQLAGEEAERHLELRLGLIAGFAEGPEVAVEQRTAGGHADEPALAQRARRDRARQIGARIVRPEHRHGMRLGQRFGDQQRMLDRQLGQRDIEMLLADPGVDIGRHAGIDAGAEIRLLARGAGDGVHQQAVDQVLRHQHVDMGAALAARVTQIVRERIVGAQHLADALVQLAARLGQRQPPSLLDQQGIPDIVLQRGQQAADLGSAAAQAQRGLRDRTAFDKGAQRLHAHELHSRSANTCMICNHYA